MAQASRGGGSPGAAFEEFLASAVAILITTGILWVADKIGLDIDVLSVEGAITAGAVLSAWKALQWKLTTRTPV